ncbi:MAG: ABC transporter ATP-binding protein [Candidatus Thorarchaeota archaeon]
MGLIEALLIAFLIFIIAIFLNRILSIENQVAKTEYNRSTSITFLILFGITIGIRYIFEFLGYWGFIFRTLTNDQFIFAVGSTIFLPLNNFLLKKFKTRLTKAFIKLYIKYLILIWFLATIFLLIDGLGIPIQDPDLYTLGLFWGIAIVLILYTLTMAIFLVIPIEKRIPKEILRKATLAGILLSYGVSFIELTIFEAFLCRGFGVCLFEQDVRIQFTMMTIVYFTTFFFSLRFKFIPEVKEKSEIRTQMAVKKLKSQEDINIGPKGNNVILDVQDLTTYFYTEEGLVRAVEGVSFKIRKGETLGLVGETGCGKSVTALSILQLVRPPGKIENGKVIFRGEDLLKKTKTEILQYRGKDITMIFQDPLNSINPVFKIGDQISEVYLLHMEDELLLEALKSNNKSIYSIAREWSEDLLKDLNIPAPEAIFDRYPHELSGGMRQRVQIAMALACSPELLIADEPTTALDVTIQNQILKLMKDLREKFNTSILYITHDLGIISKMCDRVAVMYSGYIVEYGDKNKLFSTPYHPYTKGLIASIPIVGKKKDVLEIIPGTVPNLIYPPSGCRFHPRCEYCFEPCSSIRPNSIEVQQNYFVACHLYDPQYKDLAEISIQNLDNKLKEYVNY